MIDYDPHDWRSHLFDVKGSMVKQISYRVAVCVVWSIAITAADIGWRPIGISDRGHILVGAAFGLLIVFRTNSSYDRFWEGRKLWGGIVNETRNLARAAKTFLGAADRDLYARLVRWTVAFPHACMYALREERGIGPAAGLPEAEVRAVEAAEHVPLAVTRRMSEALAEARRRGLLGEVTHMALEQDVHLLVGYMGGCERIHRTPMPFAYAVHLRRALILYCFTLPFAIVDLFGWWTILATFVIAYTFFGIEEIGVEIEDPFAGDDNDIPLERICATIEGNLLAMIEEPGPGG